MRPSSNPNLFIETFFESSHPLTPPVFNQFRSPYPPVSTHFIRHNCCVDKKYNVKNSQDHCITLAIIFPSERFFFTVDKFATILPKTQTFQTLLHYISPRCTCTQANYILHSLTHHTMRILHLSTSFDNYRYVSSKTKLKPMHLCTPNGAPTHKKTGTYPNYIR